MGRHTLRLREATRSPRLPVGDLRRHRRPGQRRRDVARALLPRDAQRGDVVVYQFATASAMAPWLAGRSETLVVNYHNVTPPELMAPWDNHLALGQLQAQGDLRLLAPRTTLAVADSRYNEAHLAASGFSRTAVISPSAALDAADHRRRRHRARRPAAAAARWLAIGRVSPNKGAREHHRRARRSPAPTATPTRRSSSSASRRPTPTSPPLQRYVAELGLAGAVQFGGHASDATVAAAYAGADVLVVTSEHEGFCVPGRRSDGRRPAGGGVRPGGGARGARRRRRARAGQGPLRARGGHCRACCGTRPVARRRRSRRVGSGWPRSSSRPAADRFVDLLVPLRRRRPPRRERHPPVRPDAAPRRRGRAAYAAAARGPGRRAASRRTSTWRWTIPRRPPRPGRSPATPRRRRPGMCWSTSSRRPRPSRPWLGARPEALVVNYHNVTPPEYYAPWDNGMARHQLLAQTQLRQLAPRAALGLAVSAFNEGELRAGRLRPHGGRSRPPPWRPSTPVPPGPAGRPSLGAPSRAGPAAPLAHRRAARAEQGHRVRGDGAPGQPGP